jgi:hypothetical protein
MIDRESDAPSDGRRMVTLNKAWDQLGEWTKAMDAQSLEDMECRLRKIEARLAVLEQSQSKVDATTAGPLTVELGDDKRS